MRRPCFAFLFGQVLMILPVCFGRFAKSFLKLAGEIITVVKSTFIRNFRDGQVPVFQQMTCLLQT